VPRPSFIVLQSTTGKDANGGSWTDGGSSWSQAILGEVLLNWFPIHSPLARGALLGVGAHGAGTAKAHEIGRQEGSVAGLVMVLVGLFSVLLAPLVAACFRIS